MKKYRLCGRDMEKLIQDTQKYFKAALALSLLFPVGVVGIVFGAILATWYGWIMLAIGILLGLSGFYVMPILWVKFGEYKKMQRIARSITDEHVYYIDMLSQRFQVKPNEMCNMVRALIAHQYIQGYVFNNNRFVMKLQQRTASVHCPNCGSNVNVYGADGVCEHCGTLVKNPNRKIVHEVRADEVFFRAVVLKECTVYPTVYDETAQGFAASDIIRFVNVNSEEKHYDEIRSLLFADTFKKLIRENGVEKFGFTKKETKKLIKFLRRIYGDKEKKYGVVGLELTPTDFSE